jgi:hypothetical protein
VFVVVAVRGSDAFWARLLVVGLVVGFAVAWAANLVVQDRLGGNRELYPMTSYPMFSFGVKNQTRHYELDVFAAADAPARSLPIELAFSKDHELFFAEADPVMLALHRSFYYGCPEYRVVRQSLCAADPVRPWVLPEGFADMWESSARGRLDLADEPARIRLMMALTPLDQSRASSRVEIFEYAPTENRSVFAAELTPP